MTKGYIEVYEDDTGRIRLYLHKYGAPYKTRVYDCWERCDFGDLRKCIYEWISLGIMAGVESADGKYDEENDRFYASCIVYVSCPGDGGCKVIAITDRMGPAGRHAWGIKEAD